MVASLSQGHAADASMQRTAIPMQRAVWVGQAQAPMLDSDATEAESASAARVGRRRFHSVVRFPSHPIEQETQKMKTFLVPALLACVFTVPVWANSSDLCSKDSADAVTLKQYELDMGDVMIAGDVDKLGQYYADDWAAVNRPGKTVTKETVLDNFRSGKDKLISFDQGPMDVQVCGNVAIVHGGVIEKRTRNGQDASGQFVWMDIWEKRAGKWLIVQSGGAKVK
jgi:ketosteroid isomerase-like protein